MTIMIAFYYCFKHKNVIPTGCQRYFTMGLKKYNHQCGYILLTIFAIISPNTFSIKWLVQIINSIL